MAIATPIHRWTEEEYLQIERRAEFRSEFFDGEMFAMAGGTLRHSLIAANLVREIGNRLKGKPCTAFNSDLRLKIEATGLYTYPDLSVICGQPRFVDEHEDTIVNPTVIVEVLSDSTEAYDRGRKFEHYRQIPSLQEYLLVSQKETRVEQFVRQADHKWLLNEVTDRKAVLSLPSLGIAVSLDEIFAQVGFTPAAFRS